MSEPTVLFRCKKGWVFQVEGDELEEVSAVSWDGMELDVNDFLEQLDDDEREELDELLRSRGGNTTH